MFDLPGVPPFPVFGLGPQFTGYRWLVMWNDRTELYTVSLGHDHPKQGSWVTVSTVLKSPKRVVDGFGPRGPTGYDTALFGALLDLGAHTLPSSEAGRWSTDQYNQADWGSVDAQHRPPDLGGGWVDGTTVVDGQTRESSTRHLHQRWVTLIDLPTVAISITGPSALADLATSIVDMRESLDAYV